ncbi:10938_t:CDS:2 [Cetraspora pellucida]|uniref:10938_t:CDS:1 n=1 Tax=Cetraspora pellucida TaxID=1433469 RepID=A0A9N8ZUR7_9GLOM|nr:10938_t:CDS:2 [Cetraspora pellucida]
MVGPVGQNIIIKKFTISKILKESNKWMAVTSTETSSKTFRHREVLGQKKDKTRVTVLFGFNATGTDKLVPWEILRYLDNKFRAQNKKILLLVDNAPSHFDPHDQDDNDDGINDEHDNFGEENSTSIRSCGNFRKGRAKMSKSTYGSNAKCKSKTTQPDIFQIDLTHVKVAFLPPNTTSHLQPLDAGIITSFKVHYKQIYCHYILNLFDDGMDINGNKLTIKQAIDYIVDAWSILPVITESDITNVMQIQQDILTYEKEDINQMIVDNLSNNNPYANSLANVLNDFFHNLDEKVPTEDFLNENDIISLIQDEMHAKNESPSRSDDSEKEPELVLLSDASKLL